MRLDANLIFNNYTIVDGVLYRRLQGGLKRRVTTVHAGRLVTMLDGRKHYGPDIAWVCHHMFVCPFPVVAVDGNPHNLSVDNVMAVRHKRLNFRVTAVGQGVRHPLSKVVFRDRDAAFKDWVIRAREYYMRDQHAVMMLAPPESARAEMMTAVRERERQEMARGPRAPSLVKTPKPQREIGRDWVWHAGRWVSCPKPVHVSDDAQVRAAACLVNPDARFRYDPTLDRTVLA